jgi:hypothetical protein
MSTLHGWDHRHSSQVPRLWLELIRAHDQIFSEANKALLKRLAIAVSIAGSRFIWYWCFFRRGGPPVQERPRTFRAHEIPSKIALPWPTLELRVIFKARCRGPLDQLFPYRSVVQKAEPDLVIFIQQRASSRFASMRSSLLQRLRCSAQDPFRIQHHSE